MNENNVQNQGNGSRVRTQPPIQLNVQNNAFNDRSLVSPEIISAISSDEELKKKYISWVDTASGNTRLAAEAQAKQVEYNHDANKMNFELQQKNLGIAKMDVLLRNVASMLPGCCSLIMCLALLGVGVYILVTTEMKALGAVFTFLSIVIPSVSIFNQKKGK